jgi:hypothetical protein
MLPAMTFSCPHFDINRDHCLRLNTDCVPGRRGCVLAKNSVFAVPVAERLAEKPRRPESRSGMRKRKARDF